MTKTSSALGGTDLRGPGKPRPPGGRQRYGCNYWEVYSPKLNRNVRLYRDIEYDHWALVEADPDITWYCEHPLKIQLRFGAQAVESSFHMLIRRQGRHEYRRVVYADDQVRASSRWRMQAEQVWCDAHGYGYAVISSDVIRQNPLYLSNWKRLLRHLGPERIREASPWKESVLQIVKSERLCSIRAIENAFVRNHVTAIRTAIFALLHDGSITAALDRVPLNDLTHVRIRHARNDTV